MRVAWRGVKSSRTSANIRVDTLASLGSASTAREGAMQALSDSASGAFDIDLAQVVQVGIADLDSRHVL